MKAVIYYTEIAEKYRDKRLEHMIGEELLRKGLKEEYGKDLEFEPRSKGEHGKPFFSLEPKLHYNISHSGEYVVCILTSQEVGIDIQKHRQVNLDRMLPYVTDEQTAAEILKMPDALQQFFALWTRKEAYVKWTGDGLGRELRGVTPSQGHGEALPFREGYSCAVWSQDPLTIEWKQVEIAL